VIQFGGTQGSQLGGIYITNNLSAGAVSSWTKLSNPPRTEGHPASIVVLNDGKMVCTFSGRINPSGSFTSSSGVFLYDPVADSWSDKSDPGMYYWTKDIILDPSDTSQNTWYVAVFSGWGGAPNGLGGLYRTIDRGSSWADLTGTQFDGVTSITYNPLNLKQAYLTTESQGLWISDSLSASIPSWQVVNSYPFQQPERVFFNPYNQNEMWVSSFGNGMKKGFLYPSGINELKTQDTHLIVYPDPATENVVIKVDGSFNQGKISIVDEHGKEIITRKMEATETLVPVFYLSPGIYFVKMTSDKGTFVTKFVKK
jgi:hypothetical protein